LKNIKKALGLTNHKGKDVFEKWLKHSEAYVKP